MAIENLMAQMMKDQEAAAEKRAQEANTTFSKQHAELTRLTKEMKTANASDKKSKQIEYDAIKADRAETKLRDSMMSADALVLKDQKVALDKMSERLQANGQVATDNKEFNDAAHKLKMDEFKFRMSNATNKGAQEEIAKERKAEMEKNGTFLEKISVGITSIGMNMKDKAKAAAGGLMKILKGTLFAGFLLAVASFLNSPYYQKTIDYITKELIPKLQFFYDGFFGPDGGFVEGFSRLFGDADGIGGIVLGIGGVAALIAGYKMFKLFEAIKTGVTAFKTFVATSGTKLNNMFGPKGTIITGLGKLFTLLKTAALATKAFVASSGTKLNNIFGPKGKVMAGIGVAFKGIGVGMVAIKTFFAATLLPAITAFLVPILPVIAIAAAIGAVLYSLYQAFEDFQTTLAETGSMGEAIKVAIGKFVGTIVGLIPSLFIKLVAFVAEMFGFDAFAEKLNNIDVIQKISDAVTGLFTKIGDFFGNLFDFDFVGFLTKNIPGAGKILDFIGLGPKTTEEIAAEEKEKITERNNRIKELETGLSEGAYTGFMRDNKDEKIELARLRKEAGLEPTSVQTPQEAKLAMLDRKRERMRLADNQPTQQSSANRTGQIAAAGNPATVAAQTPVMVSAPTVNTRNQNVSNSTSTVNYIGNPDPIFQRASAFAI